MTDPIAETETEITEFWMCRICAICYVDKKLMWEHWKSCEVPRRKVAAIKSDESQQIPSENANSESNSLPIADTNINEENQNLITPLSKEEITKDESNAATTTKYDFRPRALKMSREDEQKPEKDGMVEATINSYDFRPRALKVSEKNDQESDTETEPNTPTKRRFRRRVNRTKSITSTIKDFSGPETSETNTRRAGGQPLQQIDLTKSGQFLCSSCSKRFATRLQLQRHRRTHTRRKPYKCPHCPKAFAHKTTLNNHVRTHTGERPFVCKKCNKAFSQPGILLNHERTHNKPYKCVTCGRAFAQDAGRKAHEKICGL